jgi:hypothetical protein
VDAQTIPRGDALARRGLLFALGSLALVPIVVGIVAAVPDGARGAVFELGLLSAAAVALWGGVVARHALQSGTRRSATAYTGAILGLVVGITLVLVAISTAIGLFA